MFTPFFGGYDRYDPYQDPYAYDARRVQRPLKRTRYNGAEFPQGESLYRMRNENPREESPRSQRARWAEQQRLKEKRRREVEEQRREEEYCRVQEHKKRLAEEQSRYEEAYEKEMNRRRELATKRKAQQALVAKANDAAKKIQQAWRLHRQNKAAFKLQKFFRNAVEIQKARKIASRLRTLASLQAEIDAAYEKYKSAPSNVHKSLLLLQDTLEKICLRVDEVSTLNSPKVRAARKATVAAAQTMLAESDKQMNDLKKAALVIQKGFRQHLEHKESKRKEKAAHVVTRFIRSLPTRKRAAANLKAKKEVETTEEAVVELSKNFSSSLQSLLSTLPAGDSLTDTQTKENLEALKKRISTLVSQLEVATEST